MWCTKFLKDKGALDQVLSDYPPGSNSGYGPPSGLCQVPGAPESCWLSFGTSLAFVHLLLTYSQCQNLGG